MTKTRLIARLYERAIIRISATGNGADAKEDVREFLQGLVTQDMQAVLPGKPGWSALLSPQGKLLFDFFLWADGGDILIDCEKDAADALTKRLKIYRLRRKIEIDLENQKAVHWSDRAPAKAGTQGDEAPDDPGFLLSQEHIAVDPRLVQLGYRWLAEPTETQGADTAYLAHRLSLGVTEGLAELGSDKTLWLECNAAELNGVSFTKGCYVGQENTARMNYRNKVNRRMVVVPLSQADEKRPNDKRQRAAYPELGLSVEHRRIGDLEGIDLPDWLKDAL